jgi:hypothetical protein
MLLGSKKGEKNEEAKGETERKEEIRKLRWEEEERM